MIIHKIHIFQSDILISRVGLFLLTRQYLPLVRGTLDIISLIDIQIPIKNIPNHYEVDRSIAAFVLHFVKPIYPHQVGLRVIFDVMGIML